MPLYTQIHEWIKRYDKHKSLNENYRQFHNFFATKKAGLSNTPEHAEASLQKIAWSFPNTRSEVIDIVSPRISAASVMKSGNSLKWVCMLMTPTNAPAANMVLTSNKYRRRPRRRWMSARSKNKWRENQNPTGRMADITFVWICACANNDGSLLTTLGITVPECHQVVAHP